MKPELVIDLDDVKVSAELELCVPTVKEIEGIEPFEKLVAGVFVTEHEEQISPVIVL